MTREEAKKIKEIKELVSFTLDHTQIMYVGNLCYARNKLYTIWEMLDELEQGSDKE